jgi:hypothetical protein
VGVIVEKHAGGVPADGKERNGEGEGALLREVLSPDSPTFVVYDFGLWTHWASVSELFENFRRGDWRHA